MLKEVLSLGAFAFLTLFVLPARADLPLTYLKLSQSGGAFPIWHIAGSAGPAKTLQDLHAFFKSQPSVNRTEETLHEITLAKRTLHNGGIVFTFYARPDSGYEVVPLPTPRHLGRIQLEELFTFLREKIGSREIDSFERYEFFSLQCRSTPTEALAKMPGFERSPICSVMGGGSLSDRDFPTLLSPMTTEDEEPIRPDFKLTRTFIDNRGMHVELISNAAPNRFLSQLYTAAKTTFSSRNFPHYVVPRVKFTIQPTADPATVLASVSFRDRENQDLGSLDISSDGGKLFSSAVRFIRQDLKFPPVKKSGVDPSIGAEISWEEHRLEDLSCDEQFAQKNAESGKAKCSFTLRIE